MRSANAYDELHKIPDSIKRNQEAAIIFPVFFFNRMSLPLTPNLQRPHVHVHHDVVTRSDVPNAQVSQVVYRKMAEMPMSPSHEIHQDCQAVWQKRRLNEGEYFLLSLDMPKHDEYHGTRSNGRSKRTQTIGREAVAGRTVAMF